MEVLLEASSGCLFCGSEQKIVCAHSSLCHATKSASSPLDSCQSMGTHLAEKVALFTQTHTDTLIKRLDIGKKFIKELETIVFPFFKTNS